MISALSRIFEMSAGELSFRAGGLLRTQCERLSLAVKRPSWTRRDILRVLDSKTVDAPLRAAVAAAQWPIAAAHLRARLTRRPSRFVIDFHQARAISREIALRWPDAPHSSAKHADAILAGRHEILGYQSLSFARDTHAIDWHYDPVHARAAPLRFWADVPFLDPACGDHKIIWEINRQQYFLALGRAYWLTRDPRYAGRIARDIHSWLAANPPLVGINWASMLELAFRSLSWTTAMHFLLADLNESADTRRDDSVGHRGRSEERRPVGPDDDLWLVDVLLGLDRQLTHVERHLSRYFSPNTHLTGEALALYVVGVALPELANSARWAQLGKSVLLQEIDAQIHGDGGHAELSTCYHRYTLDFYNLALITAELEGDAAATLAFRDAANRLRDYMHVFSGADGTIPIIGDEDGGQLWSFPGREPRDVRDSLALTSALTGSHATGEVPESALWLAWHTRPAVRQRHVEPRGTPATAEETVLSVRYLPDSGYVVAHTDCGDRLTFDTGQHGFLNGGHAHADALSITLSLQSRAFLIDPGSATYTMDAGLRSRLRESASHNTVTLDGRSSAIPHGPFQWQTRATAQLESLTTNARFLVAEGVHDGYRPAEHRRLIVHGRGTGWLIADFVTGSSASMDAHWHFDPAWLVEQTKPGALLATGPIGTRAWLLCSDRISELSHGGERSGWCSPRYGALVPTFAAKAHRDVANSTPVVTWIGMDDDAPFPTFEHLNGGEATSSAVRITHRRGTILTIFRPHSAPTRRVATFEQVTTDARVLQRVTTRDDETTMSVVDAHYVATPPFDIDAAEPIQDLWVHAREDLLELWSTAPPASLRLRFAEAVPRPRRLRLNGRDTLGLIREGDVVILASSWKSAAGPAKSSGGQTRATGTTGGGSTFTGSVHRSEGHV